MLMMMQIGDKENADDDGDDDGKQSEDDDHDAGEQCEDSRTNTRTAAAQLAQRSPMRH